MRALKIAAIGLVAIVAAVVAVLFVGIPVGFLIGPVQSQVEIDTGYRLDISGSSKLVVLPSPSVVIEGASLTNTRNGSTQPNMTVERLRVEASLRNLFSGRPQITEVVLTKPVIRAPLIRQRTVQPARSTGTSRSLTKVKVAVTVDHFAVHEGTVHFVNARGAVESKLEKVELVGSLNADDQIDLIFSAMSGDQRIGAKIKGKAPHGGFDGRPIPLEFSIELPGILQAPLSASAEVKPTGSLIQINSVSGAIGSQKFGGWASVDMADKPLVKVDLDFQSVELGAPHAAGTGSAGAAATGGIDTPWSNTPFSLDGLNYLDADVKISSAVLRVGTLHFAPINIAATVENGVIRVSNPQTGLYGGFASTGFAADISGAEPAYALRMEITGVRALPLLADVANFTSIDGQMVASIDLRARGASERAIMSSLEGTVGVLFQNGEIRFVNIAQMIRNVGAKILSGWQAGQTEKTDFAQFSAGFRFDKGLATTENISLVGPLVRVTGAGNFDIGAKTMNVRLDPKLVASLEGQGAIAQNPVGLGVPVMAQGTWGAPRIYPEFAGMLENPDAAFGKLKELGLGLFGGVLGGQSGQPGQGQTQGQPGAAGGAGAILQGIGDVFKGLQTSPGGGQPSTTQPATPRR